MDESVLVLVIIGVFRGVEMGGAYSRRISVWLVMPSSAKLGMDSIPASTRVDSISMSSTVVSSSSRSGGEAASLRFLIDRTFFKMLVMFGIIELGMEGDGGMNFVKGQVPRCSF